MKFAGAMHAYTSSPGFDISHILDNYNWQAIGDGLVVDVGGARGHVAIPLAQRFQTINVLVQDMDKVVEGATAELPPGLNGRVKFMAHDILAEQTVKAADIYYFRWIFHNWSDKYAVLILRNLIPALRYGARIVIQDICMPKRGTIPQWREKDLR